MPKAPGVRDFEGLLERLQGRVAADWLVVVLADRGLYARWRYEAIVRWTGTPSYALTWLSKLRPVGTEHLTGSAAGGRTCGTQWKGEVDCFVQKKSRLRRTLLIEWQAGYEHPWVVVTDLPAAQANIAWYALRAWIEAGFKSQARRLGLAPQQDAGGQSGRATLAGNGRGVRLDRGRWQPSR